MQKRITNFRKFFGSGPAGLLISLVLLLVTGWINRQVDLPPISDNPFLLDSVFIIACVLTLAIVIWSVRSLPTADRGNRLVTTGAFRYVRHPLYAAFLSVFNFGLAVFLNSYLFIAWALLLHAVWAFLVRDEERMLIEFFGDSYRDYQERTGRFFPRLLIKSGQ